MRSWIRRAPSILTIVGGALFLVLPVAFFNGTTSPAIPANGCSTYSYCALYGYSPPSAGMVASWVSLGVALGVIGILLGSLSLKLGMRPGVGVALGYAFSLGLMTFLFWTVISNIPGPLRITPGNLLLFPQLSVSAMGLATLLYSYDLSEKARGGRGYDVIIYLRRYWA